MSSKKRVKPVRKIRLRCVGGPYHNNYLYLSSCDPNTMYFSTNGCLPGRYYFAIWRQTLKFEKVLFWEVRGRKRVEASLKLGWQVFPENVKCLTIPKYLRRTAD